MQNLVDCRKFNCNFLLNTGLMGNGAVNAMDDYILRTIGKWIKLNKGFVYGVKAGEISADGADILKGDDGYYYAVIKDVPMSSDPNVQRAIAGKQVQVNARVTSARWLDSGEKIEVKRGMFNVKPFSYGRSLSVRVARLKIKE